MTHQRKYLLAFPACGHQFSAFLLILVIIGLVIIGGRASAQTDDTLDQLFTIKGVKVDETARSADLARRNAILKAEEDAYHKLIRKITQIEDRDKLPTLGEQERQALISGIELVEELSSDRRYVATLNVRFAPGIVSDFLAEHSVPHVLGTGRDILVLHAHQRGLMTILWEEDGAINTARTGVDWVNRIRAYRFPSGEIRERVAISASEVAAFDTEAASEVSKINNLDSVLLISSGNGFSADGEAQIEYEFLATDSGISGQGVVPVPAVGHIQGQGTNVNAPQNIQNIKTSREVSALIAMYDSVLEEIDGAWRERLLVDTGTKGTIDVIAASTSLEDLANYERILSEISLVQGYSITEIGLPTSRFSITYTGRQDQLALALRFAGLELEPYGDQMLLKRQ